MKNTLSNLSLKNKYTLSDAILNFVTQKYHVTKGTQRADITIKSYKTISNILLKTIQKHKIDYDLLELNLNKYLDDPIKSNQIKNKYRNISEIIKSESKHLSHNTLQKRLNILKYSLYSAEKDMTIKTYVAPFDMKSKSTKREVMSASAFKTTIKNAFLVLRQQEREKIKRKQCPASGKFIKSPEQISQAGDVKMMKRGAFAFLLVAFTSARIKDVMSWRFSKNISINKHHYILSYKPNKTKHTVINIPLPLQLNRYINHLIRNNDHAMKDYFLDNLSYTHLLKCFRYFIKSIPELNQEVSVHKDLSNGEVITKQKKLYEVLTFHNIRATFITQMVEKGIDLETIMNFSGHTNIQTLSQKYTNISDEHKGKMYQKFMSEIL